MSQIEPAALVRAQRESAQHITNAAVHVEQSKEHVRQSRAAIERSLRLLKGKAVTPYMTGKPSSAARELARTDPVIAGRIAADVAVGYPGSVPIVVGGDMIGAITVSGSQNNTDEVCANAGLAKIQSRLK